MTEKTAKTGIENKNGTYGLTPKEEAFSEAYLVGPSKGNAVKAAIVAGYSDPSGNACKVLSRLKQHPEFIQALESAGLTTHKVAKAAAEALGAKFIHTTNKGAVETDIPDHRTRLIAARLGAEVLDMVPDRNRTQTAEIGPNLSELLSHTLKTNGKTVMVEAEYSVEEQNVSQNQANSIQEPIQETAQLET